MASMNYDYSLDMRALDVAVNHIAASQRHAVCVHLKEAYSDAQLSEKRHNARIASQRGGMWCGGHYLYQRWRMQIYKCQEMIKAIEMNIHRE